MLHDVKTSLFCLISKIVAPLTPTVPLLVVAEAPVKVTLSKSAKGTSPPLDEKSSTIHSALVSQRLALWLLKVCETDFPVDWFWMTAVPPVLLLAVTVILIVSPALIYVDVSMLSLSAMYSYVEQGGLFLSFTYRDPTEVIRVVGIPFVLHRLVLATGSLHSKVVAYQ